MKVFFALWPNDDVRLEMAPHRLEMARLSGGRPTLPITLHLTLVFLGDVPEARLPALRDIASTVRLPAFDMVIDSAGCFGRAGVAWLASDAPPPALFELQETLKRVVANLGLDVDRRTFRPHVTVARNIGVEFEMYPIPPVAWRVDEFCLVSSTRDSGSLQYEVLARWSLGK